MTDMRKCLVWLLVLCIGVGCHERGQSGSQPLDYCVAKVGKSAAALQGYDRLPISIAKGDTAWKLAGYRDWRSGFWPGILWYVYEYTRQDSWRKKADSFSRPLTPLVFSSATDHDLGFQLYCSFGNGFRLTGDSSYRRVLLAGADTLATLFNPKIGTILSWPRNVQKYGGHNTIIDNMINLELLFWASKNGGSRRLYEIAVQHAKTTMRNHFRPDYSSYHVVVYDSTGKAVKKITHQGYSDSSMWARGQAWAIYGYTMAYRETRDGDFLGFAQKVADVYLQRLPDDFIPYWDFNAPGIPDEPRDASAAAVTASALIELSTFVTDSSKSAHYRNMAGKMLAALSSEKYQSRKVNDALLLHSTGHRPNNNEVDASIIYADYYYMEALLRLKKLESGKSIYEKF